MRYPPSLVSNSLPPSHTHHTVLLTISPPPSSVHCKATSGMFSGNTALATAIECDGVGRAGAAECVALLRAAGAEAAGEGRLCYY